MLYNSLRGYGAQCYFLFAPGPNWTSHASVSNGYQPYPTWLGMQLRNRYASGDMVETQIEGGPRLDLPARQWKAFKLQTPAYPDLPMVTSYAFKDGNKTAVFVISRLLDKAVPVTLQIPGAGKTAMLYTLTGDPRTNNIEDYKIKIAENKLTDFSAKHSFSMPPGSAYLFVTEGATR